MKTIWKFIAVTLPVIIMPACQSSQSKEKSEAIHTIAQPDKNYDGVYLFNSGKDIILSWTEWYKEKRENNILKWARFDPKTLSFGPEHEIPPSKGLQMHGESMAKVGITPDGTMVAVYRKKMPGDRSRFGGLMFYAVSKDSGKTWSEERRLVKDTTSTSQSFYDMAVLPDGKMGLTWLDSRSERRGKTLYFATMSDQGYFDTQIPVAFSTCECCRTDLYTDETGKIRIAYRNLIEPDEPGFDGVSDIEIRDMYYLESVDTGKTFTEPVPISRDNWHIYGCPHTGPSMAYNGKELGVIWFTAAQNQPGLFFTKKIKDNLAFLPRTMVTPEGRHPQMTALGENYYAVYEEYYEKDGKGYYKILLNKITPDIQFNPQEISRPQTRNDHAVITAYEDYLIIAWVNRDTRHPKLEWTKIKAE